MILYKAGGYLHSSKSTILVDQLLVTSYLEDLPFLHNHDLVGIDDC